MRRFRFSSLAASAVAAATIAAALTHAQGRVVAVAAVPSPAGAGSAQPQLSVSDRGILLSWIEKAGDTATLKFAERTAGGWTPARTVASGSDWFVNWADVPSVMRLADGTLAAHWLQKSGADTYAYDVRLSYSKDDGVTWAPSFLPHHDGAKTEHGFASLFQMPGAGLGLVWLDGRDMRSAKGHEDHEGAGGQMTVRFGTFDTAWRQTAEMPVDLKVCECCPTAAAVTSEGPIVAYRNRSDAEVRDIYVSRFVGGAWSEGVPVHADDWTIPACPVNGPSLGARGREVVIAWFTVKQDVGQAFVAFSGDAGRTFGAPVRVDEGGTLGRVDVELLPDGAALATWIEFADQRAQFRARRIGRDGTRGAPVTVAGIAGTRASGYPRMARQGDQLLFAWTESGQGESRVRTAAASLGSLSTR